MPKGGSARTRATKRKRGFSSKNKKSYAHASHQHRNKKKSAHNDQHAKKMEKHAEKNRAHKTKQQRHKERHEQRVREINENQNMNPSQKQHALRQEHDRRSSEMKEEQRRSQYLRNKRHASIHKNNERQRKEDEDHRRRKYPLQYAQLRRPRRYVVLAGGGVGVIPGGMGYGGAGYGGVGGGGDMGSGGYPIDPTQSQAQSSTPVSKPSIESENESDEIESNEPLSSEEEDVQEPVTAPDSQPLPDPSQIVALSSLQVCAANKFLLLREAFDNAQTAGDRQSTSRRFALYAERLDHIFQTHTMVYVQVMKRRPKTWSVKEAETFVDQLSADELKHVASIKKEDLSKYLAGLK